MHEYNLNLHELGPTNGHVEYYKKIEKTISSTTSYLNNIRPREFTSYTNKTYSIGNELTEFMITNEYVIDATSDSSEYIDDNFTWEISLIGPVEIFLSQNG
jgi:hypothetical protein